MKRLLIGGLAVGSLLFAATGVAAAHTTATPLAAPATTDITGVAIVGGAWPNPGGGTVTVSFTTPSSTLAISGYAVSCTAPLVASDGSPLTVGTLPPIVGTFNVNPSTGASADADTAYSNSGGKVSLKVGTYSVVMANELPKLTCSVLAVNARGASKAVKAGSASPAPTPNCAYDAASDAVTGPSSPALLTRLANGNFDPFQGTNHKEPISSITPTTPGHFAETASNYDVVIADLSGLSGPSAVPFCSTNAQYQPHLISDQPVSFAETLTAVPAVVSPASKAHPAQGVLSNIKLTATVNSGLTLQVIGSDVLYAYDAAHYHIDGCKSTLTGSILDFGATSFCSFDTAAIVSFGFPAPPTGAGYVLVHDVSTHTIAPGKPIVGAAIALTVSKNIYTQIGAGTCDRLVGPAAGGVCALTTAVAGPYPGGMGLSLGTAVTTISIDPGTGPVNLPITLTAPGNFYLGAGVPGAAIDNALSPFHDTNYKSAIGTVLDAVM